MIDDDELIAEIEGTLSELVAEGHLELASSRGSRALAVPLARALGHDPSVDVAEWLLDRVEVSELYLEPDELRRRMGAVFARLAGGGPQVMSHPELEAELAADRSNVDVWRVYADWLLEHGDPRGELITLELEMDGANRDEKRALAARAAALRARYRQHFVGDLALNDGTDNGVLGGAVVTFARGFYDEVKLFDGRDIAPLVACASSRFLRSLCVDTYPEDTTPATLEAHALPPLLTELVLRSGRCRVQRRLDLGMATRGLLRLARLEVDVDAVALPALHLPALEKLKLDATDFVVSGAGPAPGSLPSVRTLEVSLSRGEAGEVDGEREPRSTSAERKKVLKGLFAATVNVDRVVLGGADVPSLVSTLADAPLAGMVRELCLRHSGDGENLGQRLLRRAAAFERLTKLEMPDSRLSPSTQTALAARWPGAVFADPDRSEYDEYDEYEDDDHYDEVAE